MKRPCWNCKRVPEIFRFGSETGSGTFFLVKYGYDPDPKLRGKWDAVPKKKFRIHNTVS
jgi:hypothetical protein